MSTRPKGSSSHENFEAIFVVENQGGQPVRVISVESGCGCASPKMEPNIIAAGESGKVIINMAENKSAGERFVPITLHTDSPVVGDVELTLHILDTRRPPYVFGVVGDLVYRDPRLSEVREVIVDTVEPLGADFGVPEVSCDLQFIKINYKKTVVSYNSDSPELQFKKHLYEVSFNEIPGHSFSGEVLVRESYPGKKVHVLNVFGETIPRLRVVPPQGYVGVNKDALFTVISKSQFEDLVIEAEGGDFGALQIEKISASGSGFLHKFRVGLNGDTAEPQTYNLIVRASNATLDCVSIPIRVIDTER